MVWRVYSRGEVMLSVILNAIRAFDPDCKDHTTNFNQGFLVVETKLSDRQLRALTSVDKVEPATVSYA